MVEALFAVIVIGILCLLLYGLFKKEATTTLSIGPRPDFWTSSVKVETGCDGQSTPCFADADCTVCGTGVMFHHTCNAFGYCHSAPSTVPPPPVDCTARLGLFHVLVGDPLLGAWRSVCESLDPGIALYGKPNNMCRGAVNQKVDYERHLPLMSDCTQSDCPANQKLITIPGNRFVRPYNLCTAFY